MSSSTSPREKGEGKRVQEDVGGRVPDKAQSLPPKMFEMVKGRPVGDTIIHYKVGRTQRWQFPGDPNKILVFDPDNATPTYGCITCSCGPSCGDVKIDPNRKPPYYRLPGDWLLPVDLWPFVEEMTAKSDDKTLVVTHITREIDNDTEFLNLFQPFGEVSSATLGPVNLKGTLRGGFGFVTFVTKEDAEKAMNTLNVSGQRGSRILVVDWASNIKKTR